MLRTLEQKTLKKAAFISPELLAEWDKRWIWHPFTQMKEWVADDIVIIESGKGCYLKDVNGKRYIDGVSSLWCNVHGHRVPELDRAIRKQLGKIAHSTFLGLSNVPAIQLAKKLIEIAPKELTRVFYSDSGSEAVEIALKMAYQYWQQKGETRRTKFIRLTNAYHGDTIGSVSVGGIDLFHSLYRPLLFKTFEVPAPYRYRDEEYRRYCENQYKNCHSESTPGGRRIYDQRSFVLRAQDDNRNADDAYAEFCAKRIEKVISKHSGEICALIMEPLIQGAAGMITQPKGFISRVRALTKKYNVLLIFDEVATGFGRTGKMWASDHESVGPDLLCAAKGLTGGYLPLAVTMTTEKVYRVFLGRYEELKTFFHGHTYTANPLASAAALANLELFEKECVLEKLQPKIQLLGNELQKFWKLDSVGNIRQIGFMAGIELVRDKAAREPYDWKDRIGIRVTQEARKLGAIIRPLGNVIVLMPPLGISESVLKKLVHMVYRSIEKVTEGKRNVIASLPATNLGGRAKQ